MDYGGKREERGTPAPRWATVVKSHRPYTPGWAVTGCEGYGC